MSSPRGWAQSEQEGNKPLVPLVMVILLGALEGRSQVQEVLRPKLSHRNRNLSVCTSSVHRRFEFSLVCSPVVGKTSQFSLVQDRHSLVGPGTLETDSPSIWDWKGPLDTLQSIWGHPGGCGMSPDRETPCPAGQLFQGSATPMQSSSSSQ